jgi:N-sulfoglucosamine sulfohydrolase
MSRRAPGSGARGDRRLTRRDFLANSAAAAAAVTWSARQETKPDAPTPAAPKKSPPPNLLLVVSDDQALEDLGCYGNANVQTPNLDRFAGESLRFTRAFTPTAICQPSRAAIHTGLHGSTSGCDGFTPLKPGVATLSAMLKKAGYRTALLGKTHLEPIEQFPFDTLVPSDQLSSGRDVDAIARWSKSFVKECADAKQPFFLNVNFDDPHWPWALTSEEAGNALPRWMRNPRSVDPRHRALGAVAGTHDPKKVRLPPLLPDRPEVRAELARYCDSILRMDRGFGLLLDVLEQAMVAENTLVLFLSDNGMEFPFHKTTLWEGGVHLPFLARWPGVTPKGATCDGMTSFVDVTPTFLEVAGAPPPVRTEGRSFRAALADPKTKLRDEVFLTHTRHRQDVAMPSRAIRTATHKYIRNFWPDGVEFLTRGMLHESWDATLDAAKSDAELAERVNRFLHRPVTELYDLVADPLEKRNLADSADHVALQNELHGRLKAAMTAIADPLLEKLG